ncbi:MAG: aspartate kinase [Oscillospiraceae bacterium]|nr:aspartate kinase [Oscillospiraceae bacterium]
MHTKVVKFGGTSLADAGQFKKVADIILSDKSRRFVVPSAPGKRFSDDIKVTDMLYACYEKASKGEDFGAAFDAIKERYMSIIRELELDISLEDEFAKIKQGFIGKAGRDYAASRGEYLSGIVLSKLLGFNFVDPANYIFFNEQGIFDMEKTNNALGEKLARLSNAVIPGFYGSMPNDTIKTFSRGGSDITGSIVARAANAEIYENWTDVSGFLIADPRIVPNPEPITAITYRELRELSYMGATVLHEDAIFPVRTAGIPINIRNTNDPSAPGTMIVPAAPEGAPKYTITGIAGKKGFSVITIEKDMMNSELGFGRKLLEVIEENGISFEHLPSGIDTMSVIASTASIEGREEKIISDIKDACAPDHVEIEHGLALIAVVGRGMKSTRGVAARIFAALAHAHINIKMIDQGSSELNIIVGVNESDFEEAMRRIYEIFVL